MAQTSIDFQDIQFKLHDKFKIFGTRGQKLRSNVNLLAVSSTQGLLFAGNPDVPEIKVAIIKQLVDAKHTGKKLHMRVVPLQNIPNAIACSADGNMLAINYTLNESGFLQIYCVQSFVTPNIKLLYNIRISPEEHVSAIQLLWNPVITSSIAAILSNGSLALYTLQDGGLYEIHTLDKSHHVKCGCWSPKGKQIVLGFPNGKLQQYKPDLTPAKMIVCPVGVHAGPFDTIAVHWLSTFQFAAVFLQHGEDMAPSLYIVNAPKGGAPSYINYYDICYSATGPRTHQITFTHIQQWNLLLATSANGVEVGILGSKENGETPTWIQYNLLDEARIEMPLTESKDETYPMGFCLDTSSMHSLVVGERQLPIMPMVHVLSTHGHLVSFDFLNLGSNVTDICSPHPPLTESSGQFQPIDDLNIHPTMHEHSTTAVTTQHECTSPSLLTSTPAVIKDKPAQLFGIVTPTTSMQLSQSGVSAPNHESASPFSSNPAKSAADSSVNFGNIPANSSQFNSTVTTSSFTGFNTNFGNFTTKPVEPNAAPTASTVISNHQRQPLGQQPHCAPTQNANELTKPLYMVPPTFKPPTPNVASQTPNTQTIVKTPTNLSQPQIDSNEVDDVVKQMIVLQINAFSAELKQLSNQSGDLLSSIKNPEEIKDCTTRLNDLQEIIEQANDKEFETDVQGLHHSLNESYAMLTECRSKLEMFKNPNITRLAIICTFDPINRRQLAKLQSYLASDQSQLQQLQLQIDSQWSNYQDLLRRNSKSKMHLPSLDGIYQRLTKLKDLVARQRVKLNYIKTQLKQKGILYKPLTNDTGNTQLTSNESIMETISDAILSMSLGRIVDVDRSKLTHEKLQAIRNFSKQQQNISIIKPQRPDRVGLKSEVILETKFQTERKKRESLEKEKLSIKDSPSSESPLEITTTAAQLAKPTATKPTPVTQQHQVTFAPPTKSQMSTPSFNFGATSPFVKTSATSANPISVVEPTTKPFAIAVSSGTPSFTPPTFTGFGGNVANATSTSFSFAQPKGTIPKPESLKEALSMPPIQMPISFSPKVIGGELAKQPSTLGAISISTVPNTSIFTALSTTTSTTSTAKPFTEIENEMEKSEKSLIVDESSEELPPLGSISSFSMPNNSIKTEHLNTSFNRTDNLNFDNVSISRATQQNAIAGSTDAFSFGSVVGKEISNSGIPSTLASNNSNITVGNTIAKSSMFTGFSKPIDGVKSPTAVPISITTTDNTNMVSSTTSTGATTFLPNKATPVSAVIISPTSSITTTVTTANPTDTFFESLDLCKPNTKDDDNSNIGATAPTGNIFSRFGSGAFSFTSAGSNDPSKNLFASANTGNTLPFSNVANETVKPLIANAQSTSQTSSSDVSVSCTSATTITDVSKHAGGVASTFSFLAGSNVLPTTTTTSATASTIFSSAIVTSPAVFTTTSKPSSIFASSIVTTTTSSSPTSIFGGASTTSPSIFGATTNSNQISIFPATTTPANSNIFGGIPKPEQSVFGSVSSATTTPAASNGSHLFAAVTNPLTFSSSVTTTASSGGNIFGNSATSGGTGSNFANSTTATPSIFGGGSTTVSSPFGSPTSNAQGGSIFGGIASTKPIEGANLFASSAQSNNVVGGGGSLFGQNTFGQTAQASGGSIFGSTPSQQQPANPSFGSGNSIFSGASNNNVSATGGSIFSGNSSAAAPGFGTFSQSPGATSAFGSPTGGSSFGQGAASVAQTGFGSPQQTSAFAKPIFGGAPAFGSPPSFGAQPSFGGAATFGFSVPNAASPNTNAFNSKFEALGSTDTGLSFGNLAQTTNTNVPKPTFGGSSFMNYRA